MIYERYVFNNRNQRDDENIDSYVAELRRLSKTCQFCECLRSSLIRDRLVIGIRDGATRKYLLQKRDLTLDNAIDICRGSEATAAHLKGIGGAEAEKVNKLHASGKFQSRKRQNRKGKSHSENMDEKKEVMCKFCGRNHELKRKLCPAWEENALIVKGIITSPVCASPSLSIKSTTLMNTLARIMKSSRQSQWMTT